MTGLKPRHPIEREAWSLATLRGAWQRRQHPRLPNLGPVVDWPTARAAVDPSLPWPKVREVLTEIEAGAREGAADLPEEDEA